MDLITRKITACMVNSRLSLVVFSFSGILLSFSDLYRYLPIEDQILPVIAVYLLTFCRLLRNSNTNLHISIETINKKRVS